LWKIIPFVRQKTMTPVNIRAFRESALSSRQAHGHKFYLSSSTEEDLLAISMT
jgi:hypothetical protein